MVKPDFDLWTGTDPIFRVVNRFCILCLISSQVGSDNDRVGSGFSFCSPQLLSPTPINQSYAQNNHKSIIKQQTSSFFILKKPESFSILMAFQIPIKKIRASCSVLALLILFLSCSDYVFCDQDFVDSAPLGYEISGFSYDHHKVKNLVSKNGIFKLGFLEKENGEFVVVVRYNLGPKAVNLPVWSVGGGVRVSVNSTVKLTMDGRLILFENRTGSIIWTTDTSGLGVETVSLLNNGNLVLMGSQSRVMWQSFDRPTNALLAGQTLSYPRILRPPATRSVTSYYKLVVNPEGIALMWENNVTY
ncbi:putative bulb-type lectin domain-containing protein [Helianthus annuus]|uniref:Bulb-type lectin domain-containing protein n=1 Tax=Helianthus annuus TaxID=4232 RepID=A0A9K3JSV5_HELAN|nr:putative bulb-type lectin domain-containing protein [Helianthus annuus]KAJ0620045.1 putative bulb-type lectin domain-containing protein [Helianthus annuus]KAJ0778504.1 putative bulb-type lectin domain-containing protein [Helianthus annuus]KAJ0941456.1 putative bulb-type lectin domain-containing protein [Helianthus annuus]